MNWLILSYFATKSITICDNVLICGNVKIYDTDFHWVDYNRRITDKGSKSAEVVIKKVLLSEHAVLFLKV